MGALLSREESVDDELNRWMVDTYANNRYLHSIPKERIDAKREEIKNRRAGKR